MKSIDSEGLSVRIISSPGKIAGLATFVRSVAPESPMLDPHFFLKSVRSNWRPCVIVVSRGHQITGLLYCREAVIAGIGTRIMYGDDSLGTMVVARSEEVKSVIDCAVKFLVKRNAATRLLVDPGKLPLLRSAEAAADVRCFPCASQALPHTRLELPASYDSFLAEVGPRTRRNFRYYRRKSEMAGNEFKHEESYPDFCADVKRLLPKTKFAADGGRRKLGKSLAMIEAMPRRIMVGLRTPNGDLISAAGGWHDGGRAFVVMQLNDHSFVRASVATVMHSYMIDDFIRRRFQELIFWEGASGSISAYSSFPELWKVYIVSHAISWRIAHRMIAIAGKFVPAAHRSKLEWLVPAEDSKWRRTDPRSVQRFT